MRLRVSPPVLGKGVEAADRREEGRLFEVWKILLRSWPSWATSVPPVIKSTDT